MNVSREDFFQTISLACSCITTADKNLAKRIDKEMFQLARSFGFLRVEKIKAKLDRDRRWKWKHVYYPPDILPRRFRNYFYA